MKNSDININIVPQHEEKMPWHSRLFKWYVKTVSEASVLKIIKVFFVTFFFLAAGLATFYTYSVVSDTELLRITTEKLSNSGEGENIRDFIVTPKIQHDLEILVYSLNADRAFIFELHNGKKNTSGLPFRFADMTYEVINEERNVDKVAMEFQNIPLTLYKYPHYLQKQKMMIGTLDEIEMVDEDFAQHIREIGGKYLGMIYLSSGGMPIAFLCVSYHGNTFPSREEISRKLTEHGNMITHLLDLRVHVEKTQNR